MTDLLLRARSSPGARSSCPMNDEHARAIHDGPSKPRDPSVRGCAGAKKFGGFDLPGLRACLSLRFQGLTPTPQYQSSASSRLWPARPAALCLPNPCRLGSDSHGVKVFLGKLLKFLTQTGSQRSECIQALLGEFPAIA